MSTEQAQCPVAATVNMVGGKWKLVILNQLAIHDMKRFNELRRVFPEITQRTLTRQLRELEKDGLVNRELFAEVPPRVEYSLTETGKSLIPILNQLRDWGTAYLERRQES